MLYIRLRWMRIRIAIAKYRIMRAVAVNKGQERKAPFNYKCPNPHEFINHCICDLVFAPPIKVLTTKEWKILDLQIRSGTISPQKREEFYSYENSVYTVNSIGVVLGGLGMLAEGFLGPAQTSAYMDRIARLAEERSQMALRGARTTHAYVAEIMKLLLDAKRDFPR